MAKQNLRSKETSPNKKPIKVKPNDLRWYCPLNIFKFKTTAELTPLDQIVGQQRAIEAIRIGAGINSKGYNIFVSGLSGTGRLTTVKKILMEVAECCPEIFDYCYVNNFENPDQPRLIKLPKGRGREFAKAIDDAIIYIRGRLPKLFEDPKFQSARRKIIEKFQQREREILELFDKKIKPYGFIRGQLENEQGITQPEVFPIIEKEPVPISQLDEFVAAGKLSPRQASRIKKLYQKFHNEIFDLARQGIKNMQEFRKAITENDKSAAANLINSVFDEIKERFNNEKVDIYIAEIKKYILENLNVFFPIDTPFAQSSDTNNLNLSDKYGLFKVNVILDNSSTDTVPVVIETTPSYSNLFGTIERVYDTRGFWRTDFSKIKAGSILQADQGFLIVNAIDLFSEPGVWPALKRVLLYNKLEIQPWDTFFNISQSHLKPEPIEVNVKVIIIGGQTLYRMLYLYEKGFKKIFKINAQFDYETERTNEMIDNYARFIAKICNDENLPHCTPDGVAAIIEWAVDRAGSQQRITLKFSDVADILREAAFYKDKNNQFITRQDVEKAIRWRRNRNDLLDEKIKYHILAGNTLIDTDGERIGIINGLTVYDTGILSFGKPSRISATISAGNTGIVNIEREVEMSGPIHSKGVMIITGFLREKFAQKHSMSLTALLTFEQSYGEIEGDSASAAEIYVLLSALSGLPIKQSLAITGSVNQKGDIQPIGGVNEKIIGFYEICKERGLTGKQGVIIPVQNIKDLMLPEEIISEVKNKKFHIYAISNIEEGCELLLGKPAGILNSDGTYTKGSVFRLVADKLAELATISVDKPEKVIFRKKSQAKQKEEDVE